MYRYWIVKYFSTKITICSIPYHVFELYFLKLYIIICICSFHTLVTCCGKTVVDFILFWCVVCYVSLHYINCFHWTLTTVDVDDLIGDTFTVHFSIKIETDSVVCIVSRYWSFILWYSYTSYTKNNFLPLDLVMHIRLCLCAPSDV